MRKPLALLGLALSLLQPFRLIGQWVEVQVVDAAKGQAIEYAHVIADLPQGRELFVTDLNGKVSLASTAAVPVIITFVGYETRQDTLFPGIPKRIALQRGDFELSDVVVTAQYLPTKAEESVMAVRIIDQETIENKGAVNLSQLLNDQLNIRLQTDGVLGTGMSMQGLSGQNVKILIDGVPMIGRLDGNIDLNQINLQDIERVEIVEGPVSVNYGSNALAGAINLITRKPKKKEWGASARAFYESVGVYNVDGQLQVPLQGQQHLVLSGGRNFFDGWSPEEHGQRDLQWNQKEQLFGRAAYQRKWGTWNLHYELRAFEELIKDKGDRRSAYSNYAFDNWFTTYRLDNQLRVDRDFNKNHRLEVMAAYNWFRRDNVQYNRDLVNVAQEINPDPTPHDTTLSTLFISRGTWSSTREKARWNYQLGYEASYETGGGKRIANGYQAIGDYALFGSLQWKPVESVTLQPGLRVSYNTAYTAQPVPSVHFAYTPNKTWQFRSSYARGFRAPTIKELHIEFIDANHNIVGNPNLQAEYSHHADASLEWKAEDRRGIHSLRLKPGLFFNQLDNMMELAQVEGSQFSYVNISQATTAGAQLEATYSIHPDFQFMAGASYLFQAYELDQQQATFESPEVRFGFEYWRPSKRFGFSMNYKYSGRTPQLTLPGNSVELASMSDFHWLDISATQQLWKDHLTLTIGGRNLFDVQNLSSTGAAGVHSGGGSVPMAWGRSVFTSLKWTL